MTDITVDLLMTARSKIDRNWIKGKWQDGNGGFCALGAIKDTVYRSVLHISDISRSEKCLVKMVANELPKRIPLVGNRMNVMSYNDDRDRTKGEILRLFDGAIARYKEKCDV